MSAKMPPAERNLLVLLCLLALPGCTSLLSAGTADVAGVASAGISGGITRNAAIGAGVGLGVAAGANAGLALVERRVHATEQDQIAAAAGPLVPGQAAAWRVAHTLPIEADQHGEVAVYRVINTATFHCKAVVFSVVNEKNQPQGLYTTTICLDNKRWRWAEAEPTTARWGVLQ